MYTKLIISLGVMLLLLNISLSAQEACTVFGKVTDELENPVEGINVFISSSKTGTLTAADGTFSLSGLPAGETSVIFSALNYETTTRVIKLKDGESFFLEISIHTKEELLDEVKVVATRDYNNVKRMKEVEGTLIFSGKRNDVILLNKTNANTAENIPRQLFSKVPGVYEWDLDGTGVQTSISVRGLNPHRSWEFNVRQNGYSINSDIFGYPESHYNPATEALSKIELVRGGACLQYGPQYGGMLNYVIKEGPTDKQVDYETRQTFGSNGMFNSYNAVGGTIGK
ncbi:MAG: carboxypeptidase-like regulatory domain-containing protein, partial [Chitinophagales bacterium]